jgi:hypothetical protein
MFRCRWEGFFALACSICVSVTGATAASMEGKNNPVTFSGVLWSRYSYILEDLSPADVAKDDNGFEIDRVYLGFSARLGEKYTGRAIVELQNSNSGQDEMLTFLKKADVLIGEPFGLAGSEIRAGQTDGVVTGIQEKAWGYRVVQKVPTDLFLGVSTTYLGVGWLGTWADGVVETDLLVANRAGYNRDAASNADPKYKTLGARAYVRPIRSGGAKGLGAGGYVQIAPRRSPSSDNQMLWFGGHAYFEGNRGDLPWTIGLQYDGRTTKVESADVTAAALSAIARVNVSGKIEIFARVDQVDFNTDAEDVHLGEDEAPSSATAAAQTLFIAGVSHAYTNSLRSILDVSVRSFSDDVFRTSEDLVEKIDTDSELIVSVRLDAKL